MYQDYGNWQQLNPSLRPADFKVNMWLLAGVH